MLNSHVTVEAPFHSFTGTIVEFTDLDDHMTIRLDDSFADFPGQTLRLAGWNYSVEHDGTDTFLVFQG